MIHVKNLMHVKILRLIYNLLLYLLLPIIFVHLWSRSRKQPEYLQHLKERFGFYNVPIQYDLQNNRPKFIWIHAVSVGETRAAQTLIKTLVKDYPDHQIVLTHMTPTGRATAQELFFNDSNNPLAKKVISVYAPYDYKSGLNRFLNYFQPDFGLILETEIWFNMIYECHKRRMPLFLVNARLSEKSFKRYELLKQLTEYHLNLFKGVAVQSESDANRFKRLGLHDLIITGNIKFDSIPLPEKITYGNQLRQQFGGDAKKIVLFASTRAGEEELILHQIEKIIDEDVLYVIVPRHPQRFNQVAQLIKQQGFKFIHKSKLNPEEEIASTIQIVLGDTMGELISYYQACDLAVIGGSLLPYGSQNLIEACSVAKPFIIGESTFNFAEASRLALSHQAGVQIHDIEQLSGQIHHLLNNPDLLNKMGKAGFEFSQIHQGATEHLVQWLHQHID